MIGEHLTNNLKHIMTEEQMIFINDNNIHIIISIIGSLIVICFAVYQIILERRRRKDEHYDTEIMFNMILLIVLSPIVGIVVGIAIPIVLLMILILYIINKISELL